MRLYVAGMVLLAVAALAGAALLLRWESSADPWLMAVFVALVALENVLAVRLPRGRAGEGTSLAHEDALLVFVALVLPPLPALIAFTAGVVVGQLAAPAAR